MSLQLLIPAWFFDLFRYACGKQGLPLSFLNKLYDLVSSLNYSLVCSSLNLAIERISEV
jgi:hypothetical protein